mmetsp:Transcript_22450/g.72298  ORF Transcript_22450/g.72298 Transcript_22450/m.72298 type:complete len:182 (-) Transcript_22450:61-606(-)
MNYAQHLGVVHFFLSFFLSFRSFRSQVEVQAGGRWQGPGRRHIEGETGPRNGGMRSEGSVSRLDARSARGKTREADRVRLGTSGEDGLVATLHSPLELSLCLDSLDLPDRRRRLGGRDVCRTRIHDDRRVSPSVRVRGLASSSDEPPPGGASPAYVGRDGSGPAREERRVDSVDSVAFVVV